MRIGNEQISKGSTKRMSLKCDYCDVIFMLEQRVWFKSHKNIDKDACKDCGQKKRVESRNKKLQDKLDNAKEDILRLYHEGVSVFQISKKLSLARESLSAYMRSIGLETNVNIQSKAKKTNLERYGAESYIGSETGQAARKNMMLNKYGSENPYDNKDYKYKAVAKSKETCLERYGVEDPLNNPERVEELNKKRRETRIKNGHEVSYDGKNAKELSSAIGINLSSFHERVRKLGIEKAVSTSKFETYLESIISQMLDAEGVVYKTQFYVDGKIADFFIPEANLIIEADGLYWHSDYIIKNNSYHEEKRELYLSKGYTPLFFRSNEIDNKLDIVKSIILNKLNRSKKLYARKCEVGEISSKEASLFTEQNHLMGKGRGRCFTLSYEGDIVAILQVKKINGTNYEISRFCCKLNTNVIGGFSRLVKAAERSILGMTSLKTFIDLRYGQGTYLNKMGFKDSKPHKSFVWTDGTNVFHRMRYKGLSGYDLGLVKIYDCGQKPFLKEYLPT